MSIVGTPQRARSPFFFSTQSQGDGDTNLFLTDLMNKSLLEAVDGGSYLVHDLMLQLLKKELRNDSHGRKLATKRQAAYLGMPNVLLEYTIGFADVRPPLISLWLSIADLTGDQHAAVRTYERTLRGLAAHVDGHLEKQIHATECFWAAGKLFESQVSVNMYRRREPPCY